MVSSGSFSVSIPFDQVTSKYLWPFLSFFGFAMCLFFSLLVPGILVECFYSWTIRVSVKGGVEVSVYIIEDIAFKWTYLWQFSIVWVTKATGINTAQVFSAEKSCIALVTCLLWGAYSHKKVAGGNIALQRGAELNSAWQVKESFPAGNTTSNTLPLLASMVCSFAVQV